jgi:hypothetical protein
MEHLPVPKYDNVGAVACRASVQGGGAAEPRTPFSAKSRPDAAARRLRPRLCITAAARSLCAYVSLAAFKTQRPDFVASGASPDTSIVRI